MIVAITRELAERLASPFRKERDKACRELRTLLDNGSRQVEIGGSKIGECTCLAEPDRHCYYCGH